MLAQKATNHLLKSLENIAYGEIEITLPDDKTYHFKGDKNGPSAHIHLFDYKVISNVAIGRDIALASEYRQGNWDSRDIIALIEFALVNESHVGVYMTGNKFYQSLANIGYLFKRNTKRGSRKNIHSHYDLGNSFYKLWLDSTMTYSSALFKNPNDDLATAQNNKYDRILSRLGDSGRLLEIGCGWGGFMARGLEKSGHDMTGITISPSQLDYAQARLGGGGAGGAQAQAKLCDYRDMRGQFDSIVSIEMFEAVGEAYWNTYFSKIKSLLAVKGRAVVQTITIGDAYFDAYRRGGDAIRNYIFPGGMLPSLARFYAEADRAGLKITDSYAFGKDYARTLQMWLAQFDGVSDTVRAQNFDDGFIRMWRFYLSYCAGAFGVGRTDVTQIELCHK
ncbi:MAG: class I SAM-dependent methyltransferase [Candidatus Halichondribacter symbioticus]